MAYFEKFPEIHQDKNAKSLSFNYTGKTARLTGDMIEEMKSIARKEGRDLRISLHDSPDNSLHNMVILQHRDTYVRPHKHSIKAEAYHLIEGEQTIYIFDEKGKVLEYTPMSRSGTFMYRFEKGQYHMGVANSDFVIFHESKIGPFVREGDSLFAEWAPDGSDPVKVKDFIRSLSAGAAV